MGALVTGATTAHTLGAKAELVASLTHDVFWVNITFAYTGTAATLTDTLVNIYVGESGAEQVLIPNLLAGWSGNSAALGLEGMKSYQFPLYIPAGTRITAAAQSVQLAKAVRILYSFQGGGQPPVWCGKAVEVIGITATSSRGVSVTPASGAEGTLTSIGTTSKEWRYVFPAIQGGIADNTLAGSSKSLDIGAATALYKDLEDWHYDVSAQEHCSMREAMGRWQVIPSSTQLYARIQAADADVEPLDVAIYGVY
jgi:hypothetical protein